MKTNRDESKNFFVVIEGTDAKLNYTIEYTGEALRVATEDRTRPPRPRSEGWTPAPPYTSELTKAWHEGASLGKMQAEIELRAKASAKMYGWPIVPALKVHHPEPYTPGKRDYAKLLEAAKRKPVGYVAAEKPAVEGVKPPVMVEPKQEYIQARGVTYGAVAPAPTPEAGWPRWEKLKDEALKSWAHYCRFDSKAKGAAFSPYGKSWGLECLAAPFQYGADAINYEPCEPPVAWLRANGHAAECERLEREVKLK